MPANIVGYGGWLAVLASAATWSSALVAPYADPVLLPSSPPSTASAWR